MINIIGLAHFFAAPVAFPLLGLVLTPYIFGSVDARSFQFQGASALSLKSAVLSGAIKIVLSPFDASLLLNIFMFFAVLLLVFGNPLFVIFSINPRSFAVLVFTLVFLISLALFDFFGVGFPIFAHFSLDVFFVSLIMRFVGNRATRLAYSRVPIFATRVARKTFKWREHTADTAQFRRGIHSVSFSLYPTVSLAGGRINRFSSSYSLANSAYYTAQLGGAL